MNLAHLKTFLEVARHGGFSAAADSLDISKGMASRHIRSLEESLQCQLFHRTTRIVTLTEAGEELLDKTLKIEELVQQAQLNIHNLVQEASGNVKLTAPTALGRIICMEVIQNYAMEYPKVKLSLEFNRQINDVEFGQFDIALRIYDQIPDNVVAKDFGYVKNILVASPQWLQATPLSHIEDLHKVDVVNDLNNEWNTWELQTDTGAREVIPTHGNVACSDYSDTLLMTKMGFGLANLPRYVVEEDLKQGALIHVLPDWYSHKHRLYLAYTKQRSYPKKVTALINRIRHWRAAHPEWFSDTSEAN